MNNSKLIPIDTYLSYIEHTENPLSSDVFVINKENCVFLFDCGNNPSFISIFKALGKFRIVFSHFHLDHIGNLSKLTPEDIYLSKNTFGYIHKGQIINEKTLLLKGFLEIIPISSSHAKGCLALNINHTYCLLGDATYATSKDGKQVYNAQLLKGLIDDLKKIDTKFFILSHDPRLIKKEDLLSSLNNIYATREANNSYIAVY